MQTHDAETAADRLCALGRRAYERHLVSATEGNLSCRLTPDRVLCTPSGACKGLLEPRDLCVIDLAGGAISGERTRSSEILMHLAIYRAADAAGREINAIVHTHAPYATAFAVAGLAPPRGILPEAEVFLGNVPLVRYETPGTAALGDAVAPFAADHVAVLLANHGAVTWAADLERAYERMEILESVCRTIFLANQLGGPQPLPAQKLAELRTR